VRVCEERSAVSVVGGNVKGSVLKERGGMCGATAGGGGIRGN